MPARTRAAHHWRPLSAALAGLLTAFALGALGQPPTEVEDPKGGVKKRIVVEDDPVSVRPKAEVAYTNPPDVRLDELARAAEDARHPATKDLYTRHTFPFDRITIKGTATKIRPIPAGRGVQLPPVFGMQELLAEGLHGAPQGVNAGEVQKVEYFEDIVLKAANDLLALKPFGQGPAPPGTWTALDQLTAAERVMAAALRFHDYGRENPRERPVRKGRGWDEVRKPLADRLREVRLLQLKNAVTVGDTERARKCVSQLIAAYPKDPVVAVEVAKANVLEATALLATDDHFKHVMAKDLLDELERNYPGEGGDQVKALRTRIGELVQKAFQRAKDKHAVGDLGTARDEVAKAAALDPNRSDVRALQRELGGTSYQTLYVGVRDFPLTMSPVTARFDSEKQAVELLFEGLLSEVPDEVNGTRYVPGAAVFMPNVVTTGREFLLRTQERDANGRYGFESHDVVSTVKLLQTRYPDGFDPSISWAGYPLPWLDALTPRDNTGLRVGFKQGHPDPRALLTFKLLPARWLEANNKRIDDDTFARAPYGTGPFRFSPDPKTPREVVFESNALHGRRDRAGLPRIKEIRLVEVPRDDSEKADPRIIEKFQRGSLHILPDVPTRQLDEYRGRLGARAEVVTATTNRRVHILAINHRRPQMRSKELRQGLMMAIDREAVLNQVFRADKPEFHRAMSGPFPPNSWAAVRGPAGAPVPLVNRDSAVLKLKTYLGEAGAKPEVTLLFAGDDPQSKKAAEAIKQQVEGLFKDDPGRKLSVILEGIPLRELMVRVEAEHRYDLAYVPFDYPDDWYPYALGAMLDPQAADRGGRNWFGFVSKDSGAEGDDEQLAQLLRELRSFREFGQLSMRAVEVHKQFNARVPFIPLWQLDRHMLVHNAVKVVVDDSNTQVSPRVLNPTTLFQGAARWRLE